MAGASTGLGLRVCRRGWAWALVVVLGSCEVKSAQQLGELSASGLGLCDQRVDDLLAHRSPDCQRRFGRRIVQAFDQVSGLASVGQDADLVRLVGQVELDYQPVQSFFPSGPSPWGILGLVATKLSGAFSTSDLARDEGIF
jgi:hypothetical protein